MAEASARKDGPSAGFRGAATPDCANGTRPMQRWTALVLALLLATFVAVAVTVRPGARTDRPVAAVDAGVDASRAAIADAGSAGPTDAGAATDAEGSEDPSAPSEVGGGSTTDAGALLLNGEAPPPLAAETPKSVVFGVILLQYKGAQGAPTNARTREAALELAKTLAAEAKQDFKATVAKGDKGSTENAGRMPRGMLEPAPEYVLFSLPKDGVSDPVDTPRGFWIIRRIE